MKDDETHVANLLPFLCNETPANNRIFKNKIGDSGNKKYNQVLLLAIFPQVGVAT